MKISSWLTGFIFDPERELSFVCSGHTRPLPDIHRQPLFAGGQGNPGLYSGNGGCHSAIFEHKVCLIIKAFSGHFPGKKFSLNIFVIGC